MSLVLVVLHVFVCIFLIAVVLLQRGKGAEIGAVFGGGASTTVFGSRGAGNFLSRLTTVAAAIFMLTSLGLSYLWTHTSSEGLFTGGAAESSEAAPEAPLFEELGEAPAADAGASPAANAGEAPAAEPGALPALPAPSADATAPAGEAPPQP